MKLSARPVLLLPLALAALALPGLLLAAATARTAAPPAAAATAATAAAAPVGPLGPRVVVLGTAQDGGVPQAGCDCVHCVAARANPALAHQVASLAIDLPASGRVYLIDATPDLGAQIERIHGFRRHPAGAPDRRPVDGVLLTHAHVGHYLGLAQFGFESLNTRDLPVWASPRMAAFLTGNGPWSELVRRRNIALHELHHGEPLPLGDGVAVTAFTVPHRDELSDTYAYLVRGPRETLLYVPDTDSWSAWPQPLPEVLAREKVSIALLDGTFYSPGELPDRDRAAIRHPLMTDTMDLLAVPLRTGPLRVYFTHLNHSNPALDPRGPARRTLDSRGFRVLAEGDTFAL